MATITALAPHYQHGGVSIYHGDCRKVLPQLPEKSAHCCVTSPPYWGLRDYGTAKWEGGDPKCDHKPPDEAGKTTKPSAGQREHAGRFSGPTCYKCGACRVDGQIGLEETLDEFVAKMVEVFRAVWRVLRDDGTLWLNLGDRYNAYNHNRGPAAGANKNHHEIIPAADRGLATASLKPKDLLGMPWSVAKALQQPYYTGRIARERDRVWLAAMIDAEGTICGATHKRKDDGRIRTAVHVNVTNSNIPLLDECARIWSVSRKEHNPHRAGHLGGLPIWRWIPHNVNEKAALIRELYPYFVAKKKQAMLAWNFFEMSKDAKRLGKSTVAQEVRDKRKWIMEAMSKLNHAESVDVPPWIQEPPPCFEPGWYLRSDVIWKKPNPMPESVTDRPTKAHEYLFLLTKRPRYYYDAEAVRVAASEPLGERAPAGIQHKRSHLQDMTASTLGSNYGLGGRNLRDVWTIPTKSYPGAHFATFPPKLIEPCIKAGTSAEGCCPECGAPWVRATEKNWVATRPAKNNVNDPTGMANRDPERHVTTTKTVGWEPTCQCNAGEPVPCTVLDPFMGSGTTAEVARQNGCRCIGVELSEEYIGLAADRLQQGSFFG